MKNTVHTFSIRKLTIGTVSLGIGTLLMGANSPAVLAEESQETATQHSPSSDNVAIQTPTNTQQHDTNATTTTITASTLNSVPTNLTSRDTTNTTPTTEFTSATIVNQTTMTQSVGDGVDNSTQSTDSTNNTRNNIESTTQSTHNTDVHLNATTTTDPITTMTERTINDLNTTSPTLKNGIVEESGRTYYYQNGNKVYDTVVRDADQRTYYFQSKEKNGELARNQWVYNAQQDTWYHATESGHVNEHFNIGGYYINNQQQFDKVLNFNNTRKYYFESEANKGKLSINAWHYSANDNTYYGSDTKGRLRQIANERAYIVDDTQLYGISVKILGNTYFYDTKAYNGVLAKSKWSYEASQDQWLLSDANGKVIEQFSINGYFKHDVQQFDTVLKFKNRHYYFLPHYQKGQLSRDQWAYSLKQSGYIYSDSRAHAYKFANETTYTVYGEKQYDTTVLINGTTYYYQNEANRGTLAKNKWAYSRRVDQWYLTSSSGAVQEHFGTQGYFKQNNQQFDTVLHFNNRRYYFTDRAHGGHLSVSDQLYSARDKTWYTSNDHGIIVSTTLTGIHQGVQSVLNLYRNSPVNIHFELLDKSDQRTASLRGTSKMYGASVPKIVLAAYTQDRIQRGLLSWNDKFVYNPRTVNIHPESYAPGGSGTIQTLNPYGKAFTVRDILERTMKNSDNIGSNMLLHYVGYKDKADFDAFVKRVYGEAKYSRNISPAQASTVMKYLAAQPQQVAYTALDRTDYDRTKLDVVGTNVHQKIGAWWPKYNHTTGIVDSHKKYTLTIMSNYLSDGEIANIVKKIHQAVN